MAKEWQLIAKDETNAEKKICDGACPRHGHSACALTQSLCFFAAAEIAKQNKADYEVAMKAYQELMVAGAGVHAASHAGDEVRTRACLAPFARLLTADASQGAGM
jgi:hypothetical protein